MMSSVTGQIKNARNEMSLYNYSKAITLLQNSLKSKDQDTKRDATFLLAECYRKQNDISNAKVWYRKSLEFNGVEDIARYYYAQALRSSGDYEEARKMFLAYDSAVGNDPRGRIYAEFCDSAISWIKGQPGSDVRNVYPVNSSESDFGVVFINKGIVFASDRYLSRKEEKIYGWTGNNYLRLFQAKKVNDDNPGLSFSQPEPFDFPHEQSQHNGPACFNHDGTELFITRTLPDKDQLKKDPGRIRTHLLKIFTATVVNGKWSKPEPFFLNSNEFSVGHPAVSPDGNTLFFVSDMGGGYGGTDIYMCTREAGKWSDPVNLGKEVNTFGNEMFPYLAGNGDLYFASDGLAGFGGLDLFRTHQSAGHWNKPENLGQPVNSSYDDFSLATDDNGKTGLFSSNRPGGIGSDDIYSFISIPAVTPPSPVPLPVPCFISGCVKDKTTKEPIPGATVFLLDEKQERVLVIKTNEKGCFNSPVSKGRPYIVKAIKTSYIPDCLLFSIDTLNRKNDLTIPRDLLLDRLEMNKRFTLENIFYDFDKWNIRKDAEPSLNKLVGILKENPLTVELGSHTDCRGSEEYNRALSQKRAESAVRYIVSKGIDPSRITARGYGKSQLVNSCNCAAGSVCTEAEHQVNRRTEFRVIGLSDRNIDPSSDPDHFLSGDTIGKSELPDGFFGICNLE
jgi:outer membrane protein OmpA-like peptidoglycan-associated protein